MMSLKLMFKYRPIHFSIIILFIINSCGVGGLEEVVSIPDNISMNCIERYSAAIDSLYQVPDSLSHHKISYDFLDIHHYYFRDEPKAIYMVDYVSGTGVRYIYDIKKGLISQRTKLSKREKKEIINRFIMKVIEPIHEMALEDGLRPDQIYAHKGCYEIIVCD